jgi:hypothetical protein
MVALLRAELLIENAKVRKELSQQDAIEQAVLAFETRFQALPGDYDRASEFIDCGSTSCLDGNGNGRVEPGSAGAIREDILVWHHLSAVGLIFDRYEMSQTSESVPTPANTPRNPFGGFLQFVFDSNWGNSANAEHRHNIKTGNYVPSSVLAEIDRKIDDGLPANGRFRFSSYAGPSSPLSAPHCMDADSSIAHWLERDGFDNCGAAILLR